MAFRSLFQDKLIQGPPTRLYLATSQERESWGTSTSRRCTRRQATLLSCFANKTFRRFKTKSRGPSSRLNLRNVRPALSIKAAPRALLCRVSFEPHPNSRQFASNSHPKANRRHELLRRMPLSYSGRTTVQWENSKRYLRLRRRLEEGPADFGVVCSIRLLSSRKP